ncbi:MAG: hypothetical protein SOI38_07010 [Eggerthellaceae bacterium]
MREHAAQSLRAVGGQATLDEQIVQADGALLRATRRARRFRVAGSGFCRIHLRTGSFTRLSLLTCDFTRLHLLAYGFHRANLLAFDLVLLRLPRCRHSSIAS